MTTRRRLGPGPLLPTCHEGGAWARVEGSGTVRGAARCSSEVWQVPWPWLPAPHRLKALAVLKRGNYAGTAPCRKAASHLRSFVLWLWNLAFMAAAPFPFIIAKPCTWQMGGGSQKEASLFPRHFAHVSQCLGGTFASGLSPARWLSKARGRTSLRRPWAHGW